MTVPTPQAEALRLADELESMVAFAEAKKMLADAAAELRRLHALTQKGGWVSVDTLLPEPGKPVLLDIGERFPIRATDAMRGVTGVCFGLLRECLGPLEVSAALIESDDSEHMDELIGKVRAALTAYDAALAAPHATTEQSEAGAAARAAISVAKEPS